MAGPSRAGRAARALALPLAVAAVAGALWVTGTLEGLDLPGLRAALARTGPLAPAAFVLGFAALQPLGVSAHLFLVLAGLLWPPTLALPLGMVALLAAASVSFGAARHLGREAVQDRIPSRVAAHERRLVERGLPAVVTARLVFFTFFPVGLLMGLTNLRWRDYLVGTALGCLPVAAVDVLLAPQAAVWLGLIPG